jgi:hypothetical protein
LLFSIVGGKVTFRALVAHTLTFYVVTTEWPCLSYFVSLAPRDHWLANPREGNFTIGDSQEICLFHFSDRVTNVTGEYDTEEGFDFLNYRYWDSTNSSREKYYTGKGTFTDSSQYLTAYHWHSNAKSKSGSFSVELISRGSTLPGYRSGDSPGSSDGPVLMDALLPEARRTPVPTRSRYQVPTPAPLRRRAAQAQQEEEDEDSVGFGGLAGIGLGFLAGVCITLIVIGAVEMKFMVWRRGRQVNYLEALGRGESAREANA